jgi:hypothetical protein
MGFGSAVHHFPNLFGQLNVFNVLSQIVKTRQEVKRVPEG